MRGRTLLLELGVVPHSILIALFFANGDNGVYHTISHTRTHIVVIIITSPVINSSRVSATLRAPPYQSAYQFGLGFSLAFVITQMHGLTIYL